MNRACVLFVLTLLSVCCAVGQTAGQTAAPAAAQKATGKGQSYAPPKTPWGDPDLQGLWPGQQEIPRSPDEYIEDNFSLGTPGRQQSRARAFRVRVEMS